MSLSGFLKSLDQGYAPPRASQHPSTPKSPIILETNPLTRGPLGNAHPNHGPRSLRAKSSDLTLILACHFPFPFHFSANLPSALDGWHSSTQPLPSQLPSPFQRLLDCIRYFCHCLDKIPARNNPKEEVRSGLQSHGREDSAAGKAWSEVAGACCVVCSHPGR